jgi:hypothetical protein
MMLACKKLFGSVPIYFLIVLTACNASLDSREFLLWSQDPKNGLRVVKEISGLNLDVQYMPNEYLAIAQWRASSDTSCVKHITVKIGLRGREDLIHANATNHIEVQQSNYYYSFLFQNDLSLEVGRVVIPCALYHFEKSSDSKNNRTFHLMFDDPSNAKEFTLVINSERLSPLPIRIKLGNSHTPKVSGL